MGARADVRAAPRPESPRADVQLHRRPDHGERLDGRAPCVGPDAEGRLPALQGVTRPPPALPERLRLPGPLDRGRRRTPAGPELQARDRGVRPRRVRTPLPRGRRRIVGGHHPGARSGSASGWTGAGTTSRSATRTSNTSGASSSASTSAAGSTSATARRSGALAAARRSPSTSSHSRASTRTAPTRPCSSGSRCSTGRTSRS